MVFISAKGFSLIKLSSPYKGSLCQGGGEAHAADCRSAIPRFKSGPWLLRYFFYYGLMPDGSGTKISSRTSEEARGCYSTCSDDFGQCAYLVEGLSYDMRR